MSKRSTAHERQKQTEIYSQTVEFTFERWIFEFSKKIPFALKTFVQRYQGWHVDARFGQILPISLWVLLFLRSAELFCKKDFEMTIRNEQSRNNVRSTTIYIVDNRLSDFPVQCFERKSDVLEINPVWSRLLYRALDDSTYPG